MEHPKAAPADGELFGDPAARGIGKQVLAKGDLTTCTVFKRPVLGSAVWPGMAFLYLALCNSAITHEFLGSFL